jgi:hypothetical protein
MGLFRRNDRKSVGSQATAGERELAVQLCEGTVSLEVVGESYRQDNLWRLVGGVSPEYVRQPCIAVLLPEDNPHDSNAIAVYISGLMVGYLPRETAAYRPGLVRLMEKHSRPVALNGQIIGGGPRADGLGKLGVFLGHDPADFVENLPPLPSMDSSHVRTGAHTFSQAGGIRWLTDVPDDDVQAIPHLRKLLASERDSCERHYLYCQLEHRLYHARNAFSSALDDYDAVCRDHDAEMDGMRSALIEALGGLPLLEFYRQAAIRHQHAHDYEKALSWAERGLAVYGEQALSSEWVDDLSSRAARCREVLNPPPHQPRPGQPSQVAEPVAEVLICGLCGSQFERIKTRGRKPALCLACRGE